MPGDVYRMEGMVWYGMVMKDSALFALSLSRERRARWAQRASDDVTNNDP